MLKLKLQYFGHLMGRSNSFEKTLMLEKIEGALLYFSSVTVVISYSVTEEK